MSNSSLDNGDTSTATCHRLIDTGVTPQPDNDISGIGVIIAFIFSAYTTLALVITAYTLGHVDSSLLRPVDTLVHRRHGSSSSRSDTAAIMLRQTVLSFSDQQIVTGIAILIAGFARLNSAMSVYHFQMVIYLAWMSSSTHLSALTMLSAFLRDRPLLLSWRITGMLVLAVLLLVALIPTWANLWAIDFSYNDSSRTGWGIPATCFWMRYYGQGINPDAAIGSLILLGSYLWKIGGIFHGSRTFFHRWVRGPTEYFLERLLRQEAVRMRTKAGEGRTSRWRYRGVMAVYCISLANFEFCSSFAASLWLSVGGLAWGSVQILVPRIQNDWWAWQENGWTFGQVTPLVLLIQPLGSVLEHIHKGYGRHRRVADDSVSETMDLELNGSGSSSRRSRTQFWKSRRNRSASRRRQGPSVATKNISEIYATLEIRNPENRTIGDLPGHQRMLYSCRYFQGLFWWIQALVLIAIIVICIFDAYQIGTDYSINWLFICFSLFGGFLACLLWTLANMPYSRVFR